MLYKTLLTEETITAKITATVVLLAAVGPSPVKPDIQSGSYRRAAVLLLLVPGEDDWEILLTRRTDSVQDHKGQVSFPGGSYETSDQALCRKLHYEKHMKRLAWILPG